MDDNTARRCERYRARIGNGMVHMNELSFKHAELDLIARLDGDKLRLEIEPVLGELVFDYPQCQRRAVYRYIKLLEHIRDSADMVLVTVRQQYAAHLFAVSREVRNVGNDKVNTGHVLLRKAHTAVDYHDIRAELEGCHILADLAETTERDNAQLCFGLAIGGVACTAAASLCGVLCAAGAYSRLRRICGSVHDVIRCYIREVEKRRSLGFGASSACLPLTGSISRL